MTKKAIYNGSFKLVLQGWIGSAKRCFHCFLPDPSGENRPQIFHLHIADPFAVY